MRRLTVVITLNLVAFWAMSFSAKAQPFQRPPVNVVWELAAWPGQDALGQPQTQDGSGEDWLYSITQSKTSTGEIDGFVAAGYSTSPNVTTTFGCQIPCSDLHGCTFATIMKIGDGGEVEWYRNTGIRDPFWKVINTSDGGFLAVGHTHDRSLFTYNPQVPGGGIPLDCWPIGHPSGEGSRRLIFAAKFDHNGNEEWKYAYGKMENPNDHLPDGPLPLQQYGEHGWDVVERPDGGFRIIACAYDPDTGFTRAFVVDVDANGVVQDRQVYGEGDPNDPSTWKRSMLMGIDRWGDDYVAVGTQYDHGNGPGDIFVIRLGEKLTESPLAQVMLTNTPNDHDTYS